MTMHDERWTLGVAENGDVRLHDQKTGKVSWFGGQKGLFHALGMLADWREDAERDREPAQKSHYGAPGMPDGALERAQRIAETMPTVGQWPGEQHNADCLAHGEHPHNGMKCLDCPTCTDTQHNADSGVQP